MSAVAQVRPLVMATLDLLDVKGDPDNERLRYELVRWVRSKGPYPAARFEVEYKPTGAKGVRTGRRRKAVAE